MLAPNGGHVCGKKILVVRTMRRRGAALYRWPILKMPMAGDRSLFRSDVARRYVGDEASAFAGNGRADHAHLPAALDECGRRLENAVLMVSQKARIEIDREREVRRARDDLGRAGHEDRGADVGKPEHGARVGDAERIEDAGLHRHFADDPFRGLLGDRELDMTGDFHCAVPVASTLKENVPFPGSR